MKSIKEILEDDSIISNWKGSLKTRDMVEEQVRSIYGDSAAKKYSPLKTFTFRKWGELGYRPKKGSKSLRSVTYVESKNAEGETISKHMKSINLFFYLAVEPIKN